MHKQYFHIKILVILISAIFLASCSFFNDNQDNEPAVDLSQPWKTASPASVNINSEGLANAVSQAAANSRFLSLLVIRNGKLVLEEYFNGNEQQDLNDLRSITKSVVSMVTGIALENGFITSMDESIINYLPSHLEPPTDPLIQNITINHLLTMTSGFQYDEFTGNSYSVWIQSEDRLQHLFDLPHINTPGSTFTYNSASTHMLGAIVQQAVGMPLTEFADQYLLNRIGIESREWEDLGNGYVNGGAGIDLRPRDLARLGQLYLQNGISGNTKILSADWVRESTQPQFSWRSTFGALQNFTYAYLWWVEQASQTAFFGWGWGGQFLYVVPDLDLVVVTTTNWRGVSEDGGHQALEQAALSVIIDYIIPAVN